MNILILNKNAEKTEELSDMIINQNRAAVIFRAESCREAEKIVFSERVDVLFAETDYDDEELEMYLLKFRKHNRRLNIIIISSGRDFMERAFVIHVSGYIVRPFKSENISVQLDNLLYPSGIEIITFGNFGIYVNGKAVAFRRSKSCEALAYLVDRRTPCTRRQIAACIFEDRTYDRSCQKYTDNILRDMAADLRAAGAGELLVHTGNCYSVNAEVCLCDYYEYLSGSRKLFRTEEYMSQYSWAEVTLASFH